LNAQQHGTDRIYFIGNFLRANEVSCQRLSYAIDYWSGSRCEARFLEHEGYFGALGAFLMSAKDPTTGTTPSSASSSATPSSSSSSSSPSSSSSSSPVAHASSSVPSPTPKGNLASTSSSSPASRPAASTRAGPKLTVDVKDSSNQGRLRASEEEEAGSAVSPSSPMTETSSNAGSPLLASFPEPLSADPVSVDVAAAPLYFP